MYYPPHSYTIQVLSKTTKRRKDCEKAILNELKANDIKMELEDDLIKRPDTLWSLTEAEQDIFKTVCEHAASNFPDCVIQLDDWNCDWESNYCTVFIDKDSWQLNDLTISVPDVIGSFDSHGKETSNTTGAFILDKYNNALNQVKKLYETYANVVNAVRQHLS